MKILKFITLISLVLLVESCSEFMEPQLDNYKTTDYVLQQRDNFMGILYNVYNGLPNRYDFAYEAATDNAVTNNDNTSPSKAARGALSTQSNPLGDRWAEDYNYINILNYFMGKMVLDYTKKIPTPVTFDVFNSTVNMQYFKLLKGEAYFLRAWYQFDLLQKYGGVADDGKAYGFVISTKYLEYTDNLDLPRDTYDDCVDQIAKDCDSAAFYLPLLYNNISTSALLSDGPISESGRASGLAAKALKARTLLYAASPAYNVGNLQTKWQKAAEAAAEAIALSNGVGKVGFDNLYPYTSYFNKTKVNDGKYDNKDIFFRGKIATNTTTYESENFPPRANGAGGYYNPTKDLVDAFPMKDGYPINESPLNLYDPNNELTNRDPRLDRFIVVNGETFATTGSPAVALIIDTKSGGLDAFGSNVKATRTGYYLQKHLDNAVNLNAIGKVTTTYAPILLGKPELYLNFAEAAVNATGSPDASVSVTVAGVTYTYNAREVLQKIRNRALGASADKYLATITTASSFFELIKNERRIELCFENQRFWDLRRWANGKNDLTLLNQPVHSIYSSEPLEIRAYKSPYMPMPYSEILKTTNLVNNAGY